MIKEALGLPEAEVEIISELGGMTNVNYLVSINSERYIVRVPGNGTEDFINRREERRNLDLATTLLINPEHIFFDVDSGLKITRNIKNAKLLTPEIAKKEETLKMVSDVFRKLHCSTIQMTNRFELFNLMDNYERLAIGAKAQLYNGYQYVKADILSLKLHYDSLAVEQCPSHIDPSFTNFIICGKGKLYLIDWEYSGMFDPLWDLAAYSMESGFSRSEEELFHTYYFKRELTIAESERIVMHKIFQDYLWCLWTAFKEAKGDDFGGYGKNRFERAKKNIELFKETFTGRY